MKKWLLILKIVKIKLNWNEFILNCSVFTLRLIPSIIPSNRNDLISCLNSMPHIFQTVIVLLTNRFKTFSHAQQIKTIYWQRLHNFPHLSVKFELFFIAKTKTREKKNKSHAHFSWLFVVAKKKSPTILQLMKSHFGNFTFVYNPTWTAEIFCFFLFRDISHMIQKLTVGWRKRHWVASSGATRFREAFWRASKSKKTSWWFYILLQLPGEIYLEWFVKPQKRKREKSCETFQWWND